MAKKRMFDNVIIKSDSFLEMPDSTQNLYFHLSMEADDDGFVNNWKSIMRMCGKKEDDLKILIMKSFVIPFDSGVIVIKHWRINNYLRSDRYNETKYLEEKQQLNIEQNGEYSLKKDIGIPSGIPSGNPDKNSIDKNSIIYNILYIWEKNIPCDCITHKGEKCLRRSAYQIDGKNFCNQHSKSLLGEHFEHNQDIKKFKKPTVEQVENYCKERKNDIDANKFVDYYDSIGWLVGKKPMKDWKACVRTWERKEKDVLNSKPDISTPDWFNKDIGKQQDNLQELEDIFKDFGG